MFGYVLNILMKIAAPYLIDVMNYRKYEVLEVHGTQ